MQREVGRGEEGVEGRTKGKDWEREGRKVMKILHIAVHWVYQFVLAIAGNKLAKHIYCTLTL